MNNKSRIAWNPKVGMFFRPFDESNETEEFTLDENLAMSILWFITFFFTVCYFLGSIANLLKFIQPDTFKYIAGLMAASRAVLVLMLWHSNFKNMAANDLILVSLGVITVLMY